jgi:hypothetical protein
LVVSYSEQPILLFDTGNDPPDIVAVMFFSGGSGTPDRKQFIRDFIQPFQLLQYQSQVQSIPAILGGCVCQFSTMACSL